MGRGHVAIKVFSFRTESEWTMLHHCRAVGAGGPGGHRPAPPYFGRLFNPISNYITTCIPPSSGFSDLPTALPWAGLRVGSYISFRISVIKRVGKSGWFTYLQMIYIQIQWPSHLYLLSKTKEQYYLAALKSTNLIVIIQNNFFWAQT